MASLLLLLLSVHPAVPLRIPPHGISKSYPASENKPNIVFIFADDIGFNDLGYHGCTTTQTPFLDNLIRDESLWLPTAYTSKICSPARSSFLTGRYPHHLGLQNLVFSPSYPVSLTRQVSTLSDEFKSAGYSTHIIGKWHLGMQSWEYTPTYRGFDTFRGFYNGYNYYYEHTLPVPCDMLYGGLTCDSYYDLRIDEDPDLQNVEDQTYGMWLEQNQTLKLLKDLESTSTPFFLYLAFQAAHSPSEAPDFYANMYSDEWGQYRQFTQAQVTILDETIQAVVQQLKASEMWDNTLMVFQSDNGAPWSYGDNFPLRGYKNSSFEGGIRVPAFVTGGYLSEQRRGLSADSMIVHSVDWYRTLLSAAGIDVSYARSRKLAGTDDLDTRFDGNGVGHIPIDGQDLWRAIQYGEVGDAISSASREVLLDLNIDGVCDSTSCGAIRVGKWKFLRGANMGVENDEADLTTALDDDWTVQWLSNYSTCDLHPDLQCGELPADYNSYDCYQQEEGCLFDLESDPCEYYNVGDENTLIRDQLIHRLDELVATMPDAIIQRGNELDESVYVPQNGDTFWSPFMRYDSVTFEHELSEFYRDLFPDPQSDDNDNGFPSDLEGEPAVDEEQNGSSSSSSSSLYVSKQTVTDILFAMYFVAMFFILLCYWCWFRRSGRRHGVSSQNLSESLNGPPMDSMERQKYNAMDYGTESGSVDVVDQY